MRAVAAYVGEADAVAFVAIMDVAFVSVMGAALAMFPRSVVDDAIKAGTPSPALVENAQEVLNVVSSLLNDATVVHVKVRPLVLAAAAADIKQWTRTPRARSDYGVSVAGYPDSKLTLIQVS